MDRRIEMSGKGDNTGNLKDLILQEQILETLPGELVTYVKDREPENTSHILKLIQRYEEARPGKTKLKDRNRGSGPQDRDRSKEKSKPLDKNDKEENGDKHKMKGPSKGIKCFFCSGNHPLFSSRPEARLPEIDLGLVVRYDVGQWTYGSIAVLLPGLLGFSCHTLPWLV